MGNLANSLVLCNITQHKDHTVIISHMCITSLYKQAWISRERGAVPYLAGVSKRRMSWTMFTLFCLRSIRKIRSTLRRTIFYYESLHYEESLSPQKHQEKEIDSRIKYLELQGVYISTSKNKIFLQNICEKYWHDFNFVNICTFEKIWMFAYLKLSGTINHTASCR